MTGKVKWFDSKKGYGFITAFFEAANAEIFRKISIFVTRLHVSGTGSRSLLQSGRRREKTDP